MNWWAVAGWIVVGVVVGLGAGYLWLAWYFRNLWR